MHTDLRPPNGIMMQILSMSVTKNLQLKFIPGQVKGQEKVNESSKDFVLFLKSFPQMITSIIAVESRLILPKKAHLFLKKSISIRNPDPLLRKKLFLCFVYPSFMDT